VKVRGNAQHVFEKYQQLARDANAAGDRVLGENYLQHAEHYFRLLRAIQPTRPVSEIMGRDQFASGYDIDFEDESGQPQGDPEAATGEAEPAEARQPDGGGERRDDRDRNRDRGDWQPRGPGAQPRRPAPGRPAPRRPQPRRPPPRPRPGRLAAARPQPRSRPRSAAR
jgi:hypothetical protein